MGDDEIRFGPFVLDAAAGTLRRDGELISLGQRALALLVTLARARGTAVSKSVLLDAGWPGLAIEEGNLTVQMAALRKALGPRLDEEGWIATVPRFGYRLVQPGPASSDEPAIPLLAVLPFQNLSSDPEQDYFADGIVEDLITGFGRFRILGVVSRASSLAYKVRAMDVREVAHELQASYVLVGSVRKAGGQLRVTAQLADGRTGSQLWADTFDGKVEDIFVVQDHITERVVAIVEPTIKQAEIERARRKPPRALSAYDLYLQALSTALATDGGAVARSIELIEKSLAIDPGFAPALGVAAGAYLAQFDRQLSGASEANRLKGLAYAHAALAAAGSDAAVRAAAGYAVIALGDEFDAGILALRQAVADNPNSAIVQTWLGTGALHAGTLDEAEQAQRRALSLNPNDIGVAWSLTGLAFVAMCRDDYEQALGWATRAQLTSLQDNGPNLWVLVAANALLGRNEEALRWRTKLLASLPTTTIASVREGQRMRDPARLEAIIRGLRLAGLQ